MTSSPAPDRHEPDGPPVAQRRPVTTELHGRCHHPIVGGDGVFAGARGELSFTDVVDANPVYYPYWGNVQLGRKSASGPSHKSTSIPARLAGPVSRSAAAAAVTPPC